MAQNVNPTSGPSTSAAASAGYDKDAAEIKELRHSK